MESVPLGIMSVSDKRIACSTLNMEGSTFLQNFDSHLQDNSVSPLVTLQSAFLLISTTYLSNAAIIPTQKPPTLKKGTDGFQFHVGS